MFMSNVVNKENLRGVQSETLQFLAEALKPSFGPDGSNTTISGGTQALTRYTKDGKSILSKVMLMGEIEESVRNDLYEITRSVVKNVGDGTTSAVILSHIIFEELRKYKTSLTPFQLTREFQKTVNDIMKNIRSRAKELDLDSVYKIALVSTNGNERIAEALRDIYEKFGMGVFIDVAVSSSGDTAIKEYNGMNLETGYMDPSFVNAPKNLCSIPNPRIYTFIDPVNTPDQIRFLDKIIYDNIMVGLNSRDIKKIVPTVILVPSISRDLSAYIDNLVGMFAQQGIDSRLPLCIVNNIIQTDQYMDIIKMIGGKPIRKYIDKETYNDMVTKGVAPTLENVSEFYGTCELFEASSDRSKFINPSDMRDENGEYTKNFKNHLEWLENELKKRVEGGGTAHEIGEIKRRIQSLKANLVEFHIGGISAADRDSVRDLVEDAVLNIRSAAEHGFGMASNVEGLVASSKVNTDLGKIIHKSYKELIGVLYENSNITDGDMIINQLIENDGVSVYDVLKKEFSTNIIGSIEADCAILDAIAKILTLLFTSNQYLCTNIVEANRYNIKSTK